MHNAGVNFRELRPCEVQHSPPRSARAAGEGMLTSSGIMRPPQGPERKRA
jgi:hypothetical protein